MDLKFGLEKCEDSGAVFTVDHAGSELEISNASCLEKTQVAWLEKHKDEVINFLWKKQELLLETKKVFHDLDLPWHDEDFKSLSIPELETELTKALPLLQDLDLLQHLTCIFCEKKDLLYPIITLSQFLLFFFLSN